MSVSSFLRRLHDDVRGVSTTEFVVTLPVFLIIFAGLLELGEFARTSVRATSESKLKTVEKFLDAQSTDSGGFGDLIDDIGFGAGPEHLSPVTGGGSAANQLQTYPPRGDSVTKRTVITAYEANTYRGLATNGTFGEAAARIEPLTYGNRYAPTPIAQVVGNAETSLFGRRAAARVLGFDLLSDRLSRAPLGSNCRSLLGFLSTRLNSLLSRSGVRPMLAAGQRYGTVTGSVDRQVQIAGRSVDVSTHWNSLVAPNVFRDDPHLQTALATYVTRLALKTCSRPPYQRLLGISRGGGRSQDLLGLAIGSTKNRRLPAAADGFHLKVPDPHDEGAYDEVGFRPPFVYYGRSISVDYLGNP